MSPLKVWPCIHCGTAIHLHDRSDFCRFCGHEPFAARQDCACPACALAAVPDLLLIAEDDYPEPGPDQPEGGSL